MATLREGGVKLSLDVRLNWHKPVSLEHLSIYRSDEKLIFESHNNVSKNNVYHNNYFSQIPNIQIRIRIRVQLQNKQFAYLHKPCRISNSKCDSKGRAWSQIHTEQINGLEDLFMISLSLNVDGYKFIYVAQD